jgi:hypothetical protein
MALTLDWGRQQGGGLVAIGIAGVAYYITKIVNARKRCGSCARKIHRDELPRMHNVTIWHLADIIRADHVARVIYPIAESSFWGSQLDMMEHLRIGREVH